MQMHVGPDGDRLAGLNVEVEPAIDHLVPERLADVAEADERLPGCGQVGHAGHSRDDEQVIPGDGDTEVPLAAQIFVQFSRSVAPLTTLSAQRTDPVVAFEPALHGAGEWLNTSIYRFLPTDLAPATTYHLKVAKGLTSAADGVLQQKFINAVQSSIGGGTDEIQRNIVGERVLGLPREPR